MADVKVNSASQLVSRIRDDVRREAMQQIIGQGVKTIGEVAATEFTLAMVEEFQRTNPVYASPEEGREAKYSNKWFYTSDDEDKIGHFFTNVVAAGINNSRPPAPGRHQTTTLNSTVSKATEKFMSDHFSSLTRRSLSTADVASNEPITIKRLKQNEALLGSVTKQLAQKMNIMMTASSYSYYAASSGMTRWVYDDITLYLNASAKNIEKYITHSMFRTRTMNTENLVIRFTIKDINLLEFLYEGTEVVGTWQEAYVKKKLAIIVHDDWKEGDMGGVYRKKMHD